ncbi:MAG: hypothetical protein ACRD96_01020, partial [Bryobacteraceae bacterium]
LGEGRVEIGGMAAEVLSRSPFLLNVQAPLDLASGAHTLRIGAVERPVEVMEAAPGIFVVGGTAARPQGAVVNQDGRLNTTRNPSDRARSLTIFGTGLGAVTPAGAVSVTRHRVEVVVGGAALPAAFAGLSPGFVGLYQVNVPLPAAMPPDLSIPLLVRVETPLGAVDSNTVFVAVQ